MTRINIMSCSVAAGLLLLMGLLLAGSDAFSVGMVQPHLVHDVAPPQILQATPHLVHHDVAPPQSLHSANESAASRASMDDNQDVSDEMERMVHLDRLQQGLPGSRVHPETTGAGGPGAADTSLEASGAGLGLYDAERDRGEEERSWAGRGAEEERKRRGGRGGGGQDEEEEEVEEEVGGGEESLWDQVEDLNHTAPGLDALIGYSASLVQGSVPLATPQDSRGVSSPPPPPGQDPHAGPQELRAPLLAQVTPLDRDLWEAEGEEEGGASSGYGVFRSSGPTAPPSGGGDSNASEPLRGGDANPAEPGAPSTAAGPLGAGPGAAGQGTSLPDTSPGPAILGTSLPDPSAGAGAALLGPSLQDTDTGPGTAVGTSLPDTNTGTDFGLVGSPGEQHSETEEEEELEREEEEEDHMMGAGLFTHNPTVPEVGVAPSRRPLQPSMEDDDWSEQPGAELDGVRAAEEEAERKWREIEREAESRRRLLPPLTTDSAPPTVGFTNLSWDWLERTTPTQAEGGSEVRGGGVTEEIHQVVCIDWRELAGRGYVILNMTDNMDCEEFRAQRGVRLLEMLERIFARRMNSPAGSWVIYLSKPTHHQHQLLMNVASEHGVIPTKDVLSMLGEIRRNLNQVGIQNYSAASHCQAFQSHSQSRSDYGKLFVVLVIIGSICMVIISAGLVYICWTRRSAAKTMTRAEELHFVENGCHDNPTLDVATDGQSEMQEKKATNGLAGGERGGEEGSHWKVFVNQPSETEEEEQDTHL